MPLASKAQLLQRLETSAPRSRTAVSSDEVIPCLTSSWDQETLTSCHSSLDCVLNPHVSKASVNLIAILNFTPKIYPIGKLHAKRLLESSRPRRPSPDTAGPLGSLPSGFLTRVPVHRRLS